MVYRINRKSGGEVGSLTIIDTRRQNPHRVSPIDDRLELARLGKCYDLHKIREPLCRDAQYALNADHSHP